MSQIEKRRVSDHDAQIVAGVSGAAVKVGVAAAALVASGPAAAIGALIASELTGVVLESEKQRLADFFKKFATRIVELPADVQDRVKKQLDTDAGSRLFETAWHHAAQEVDPQKLDSIAALLKNSLSSEVLREHQTRWLLKLLNQLDLSQIVILQSFTEKYRADKSFRERHTAIFQDEQPPRYPEAPNFLLTYPRHTSPRTVEQAAQLKAEQEKYNLEHAAWVKRYDSYKRELPLKLEEYELARERHALHESRLHNLVEIGLLGAVRAPDRWDREKVKVTQGLTPLGLALLKVIDAVDTSEWGQGEQINTVQAMQQSLEDIARNAQQELEAQMQALNRPNLSHYL